MSISVWSLDLQDLPSDCASYWVPGGDVASPVREASLVEISSPALSASMELLPVGGGGGGGENERERELYCFGIQYEYNGDLVL